jgi:hypothetical protein
VSAALLAAVFVLQAPATAARAPRIAIIVDDLGDQLAAGRRAVDLPGPVACAVLPGAPRAALLAEAAFARGKEEEVLLHLPLQSINQSGTEPKGELNGIVLDMSRREFARSFAESIASVPHAVGVSNHQGSLLTQHPGHMGWLMEEIEAQGNLFFVDSYTTHRSVALAIAHPYPPTLDFLETELPQLAGEGYELVGLGEYIALAETAAGALPAPLAGPSPAPVAAD